MVTQLEKVAPMTDLTLEGFNLKRMMREKGIARARRPLGRGCGPRGNAARGRRLRPLPRRLGAHDGADQGVYPRTPRHRPRS